MQSKQTDLFMNNRVFIWTALATGMILLVPFVVQLMIGTGLDGTGFNWHLSDFIVMGTLVFGTGSLFILVARRINKKYRIGVALAFVLAFLWIWAELAVGVFTNLGS